ncbi:PD-(D/E)XK nuclease family protein [Pseudoduganella sp. SL102]|uniref:PD-(D/E)XK nuclease family protein n=1 Tax=Pseudoduganella sp. SL102 TaxID=2995154 RepID=UPI00248CF6B2|nr:PD-(D/E)XK nuclease family protein [Pseudoduganella sp. SL102]WBS04100.1 PD-(D/E)XK nuclease family protein [Pseudoduganella sp. SL102]
MTSPIILCATNRLAQTLRSAIPEHAAAVWNTPQAFALEAWMDQLGEEAMLSGVISAAILLDAFAEKLLWQQVIADSINLDDTPLFDIAAMAVKAADAYAIARIWALDSWPDAMSREAQLFAQWRMEFQRRLGENGWTVAVDRREAVVGALEQGALRMRSRVVFAGFNELNPLHQRLRAALDATMLASPMGNQSAGAPTVIAFQDVGAECRAAVRWAGTQLATNPSWRIGIVVPDLSSVRDHLEHELEHALHPELAGPAFAEHPRRYNFSLGRALADTPIVACALQLLGFANDMDEIEQPVLTSLLLNPYWSDSVNETDARSVLDAQVRRRLRRHLSVAQVVTLASRPSVQARLACPMALQHLSQLLHHAAICAGEARLPSEWAQVVRALLHAAGWAGSGARECRTLSSHEYQAREAWSELLDRFARADQIIGALPFSQVLAHLHALCGERMFQPQTRGTPSVHVVGMLESTGLHFDALWVMGMHDGAWPPAPAPNPLIPVALQRSHGIPNSCAAVQLAYARTILRRLQCQAPVVHFSCALMNGSQELRHSPLFVLATDGPTAAPVGTTPARWGMALECLDDAAGPALQENERVRGGVSLLRAQAVCPAWAFYQYRLGAAALERPQAGLGAQERGTLVHDALEWFWNQVDSRQALADLAAAPGALDLQIHAAVIASLEAYEARSDAMPAGARELEVLRLTRLLREWLQAEICRADFVVLECERELKHQIGPVALTLRIDRIDQQDGKLVVIDYKTGTPGSIHTWAATRIIEPQLPIYALALSNTTPTVQIGALVYGKVRLGESRFLGLSATDNFVDRVRGMHHVRGAPFAAFADWEALQVHWQERIEAVADEFARGMAGVSIDGMNGLDYCEVLPLLRLSEREAYRMGLLNEPVGHGNQPSRQEF